MFLNQTTVSILLYLFLEHFPALKLQTSSILVFGVDPSLLVKNGLLWWKCTEWFQISLLFFFLFDSCSIFTARFDTFFLNRSLHIFIFACYYLFPPCWSPLVILPVYSLHSVCHLCGVSRCSFCSQVSFKRMHRYGQLSNMSKKKKKVASNGTLEEIVRRRYEEVAVKGMGEVKCSGTEEGWPRGFDADRVLWCSLHFITTNQ